RENIEWCNVWVAEAVKADLPRVLLIGDSICNGYRNVVEKELKGKACVAMLATSASLEDPAFTAQLKLLLDNYKFAVVHFNNGLHGFGYAEDEYQKDISAILKLIKQNAPDAKLIWATSTPMRNKTNLQEFNPKNERVKARNKIVVELAAKQGIPVDDLYSIVVDHPEYWRNDGVHYKPEGQAVQAKQVAKIILETLAK
ncbi:MAG: SGNH/GDSL hydrolase family protein, partial [Planctomycetaceae bacterium]|nr:SGNH/GDSL hydrolase family protein [Planctomycetaceae bacterium]